MSLELNNYKLESLVRNLAYFTEANLATFETLKERKSTSKSDLKRQGNICFQMICQCAELRTFILEQRGNPRLGEILKAEELSKGIEKFGLVY